MSSGGENLPNTPGVSFLFTTAKTRVGSKLKAPPEAGRQAQERGGPAPTLPISFCAEGGS